jgi:hopanoid biosynthesis associated RND transporter like protein HpnN
MIIGPGVGRLIAAVVRTSTRRPVVTVVLALLLTGASVLYTVHGLSFITSAYRLLPQNARYVVLLREYLRDFGELNDVVVAIEASDPERSKAFAARLHDELRGAGIGAHMIYRIDPGYFEERALLYLSVDELVALRDHLLDREEFLDAYGSRPTLARLLEALNQQIANAMVVSFFDIGIHDRRAVDLRFLESVLTQMTAAFDGGARYVSPWVAGFSLGRFDEPDVGYFFSSDRRLLFFFVQQGRQEGNFTDNRVLIDAIRSGIARLQQDYPDVRAGVTGAPAISNDEMTTALADSRISTMLALVLTVALLLLAFRRVGAPLLMALTLMASLAWSVGITTFAVGHLTIFSVMFISIVVGIGIDYGIYFLYRYDEETMRGHAPARALARTAERTGPGILLGALTAAGAFFVLMLTDFQGIREFGFVSGTAILCAFLAMVTLFPALLVLAAGRRPTPAATGPAAVGPIRETLWLARLIRHRRPILLGALALSALALWGTRGVAFDYNMLKLQAKGVESVAWEERILRTAGRSGFAAITAAGSLDELRRKQAAFAALPSVSRVESILAALPDAQADKVPLIAALAPSLQSIAVAPALALDPTALRPPLETLRRRLRLALDEATGDQTLRDLRRLYGLVEGLLAKVDGAVDARASASLGRLQDAVRADFVDKLRILRKSLDARPLRVEELPADLRQRYIGASGRFLLRVHPAVDIWQQAGAERFVHDLRTVDPDVTGPPITSFEAIRYIRQGYLVGTLYAFVLVAAVTALVLRSARGTALALTPLVLGVAWTLGLMRVFGLEFNLANVWALPLIIGTSAEYGLNIFVRFLETRAEGGPTLAHSAVMAVVLNGLTTIVGFGSLMIAHHRGIFGLGLLLTIGACAALLASLVVLPVLIELFGRAQAVPTEGRLSTSDAG